MNPADWYLALGEPALMRLAVGLRKPKHEIVGSDFCGTVDAVGPGVTDVAVGDEVFGSGIGAFSQYAIAKVDRIVSKPASMSAAEAAGLPIAGVTALQGFETVEVEGRRVVVNGASGGVGHYAIQIALALGASHVAGVCSTRNLELVESLGAHEAIDYTSDDFTSRNYDVIVDCAGRRSFADVKRCLSPGGNWIMIGAEKGGPIVGPLPAMVGLIVRSKFAGISMRNFVASETADRLASLAAFVDQGKLKTHIECEYPLDEIRAAFDHSASHRSRGKVIIDIPQD
jgi:NADPH:quinone reductase-like Zn-dependent oxidoreductase